MKWLTSSTCNWQPGLLLVGAIVWNISTRENTEGGTVWNTPHFAWLNRYRRMNVTFQWFHQQAAPPGSLISLQQMDSNYRYPVNYYHVDNTIIRILITNNGYIARMHVLINPALDILKWYWCSYRLPQHQHPQVRKLHLTNLRCLHCSYLPCNNISMQITRILRRDGCLKSVRTVGKTDISTIRSLGISIENNHYRFVLKVKSHN